MERASSRVGHSSYSKYVCSGADVRADEDEDGDDDEVNAHAAELGSGDAPAMSLAAPNRCPPNEGDESDDGDSSGD